MLWIKDFNEKRVIITDGKEDYVLEAKDEASFDRDIIEDILDYSNRQEKKED